MADATLSDRISQWNEMGQYEEIIEAIEALPEQEQTDELITLLARAYLNEEEYGSALRQLDRIRGEFDAITCARYGLALYCLHREHESIEWFERAHQQGLAEVDELPGSYFPTSLPVWLDRARQWAPRRIEKNAFERQRRQARNQQAQTAPFAAGIPDGLWNDCAYSLEKYMGKPPSDADFAAVEQTLGYRLPESYKALMRQHNGGIFVKDLFENPMQRDWWPPAFSVQGIYGVDGEKPHSLCGIRGSRFWIEDWGYPDIGIAICDAMSGGHNMIFLDYSDCGPQGEPCVVEIDQESNYETTYLADCFEDFILGLTTGDDREE